VFYPTERTGFTKRFYSSESSVLKFPTFSTSDCIDNSTKSVPAASNSLLNGSKPCEFKQNAQKHCSSNKSNETSSSTSESEIHVERSPQTPPGRNLNKGISSNGENGHQFEMQTESCSLQLPIVHILLPTLAEGPSLSRDHYDFLLVNAFGKEVV